MNLILSGFCHFGLVYSWICFHVNAWLRVCSFVCVPCFLLKSGVWILALMSCSVLVSCRGSDTRAPCSVLLCECVVLSLLGPCALLSACVLVFWCSVFLVVSCSCMRLMFISAVCILVMFCLVLCIMQLGFFTGCVLSCCHVFVAYECLVLVTLYSKGTWITMNSCINECVNYALLHALISHELSGTNMSSKSFIHDFIMIYSFTVSSSDPFTQPWQIYCLLLYVSWQFGN